MHEIERQFLMDLPSPEVVRGADAVQRIRQAYLTEVGPAIRVRQIDDRTVLTVKRGGGLVRREVEFDIPAEAAEQLFEMAPDQTITKTRYVVGRWELDVFEGPHAGLCIAEVELESEDEPTPAVPAGVRLGREVTEEAGFTNQFLAHLTASEAAALVGLLSRDINKAMEWVRRRAEVPGTAG